MNQKDKLEEATIKALINEEYKNKLYENNNIDIKNEIKFIKKLLGKSMNNDNYKDKSYKELNAILNTYKKEYMNKSYPKYIVYIMAYNKLNNYGISRWLNENNEISSNKFEARIFNSEKEAQDALNNYNISLKQKDSKYEILDDSQVLKVKFKI